MLVKQRLAKIGVALLGVLIVLAVFYARMQRSQPVPPAAGQTAAAETRNTQDAALQDAARGGAVVKGAVSEQVLPEVLERAQESIRGSVLVRVRVDVDAGGGVSSASLEEPGKSKYFAKQALQAAQAWRFKPAQVDGQAVRSVWLLRFEFLPTGTEIAPLEVSP